MVFAVADLDFVGMSEVRRWAVRDVSRGGRPAVVLNHRKPLAVLVPYEWFVEAQRVLSQSPAVGRGNSVDDGPTSPAPEDQK